MLVQEEDILNPNCPYKDCFKFQSPYFTNLNEEMLNQLKETKQVITDLNKKPHLRDVWCKIVNDDEIIFVITITKIDYRNSILIGYDCLQEPASELIISTVPIGDLKPRRHSDTNWQRNADLSRKIGMVWKDGDEEFKVKSVYYNKEKKEFMLVDINNKLRPNFILNKNKTDGELKLEINEIEEEIKPETPIQPTVIKPVTKPIKKDVKIDVIKLNNTSLFSPIPSPRTSIPCLGLKLTLEEKDIPLNTLIECRNIYIPVPFQEKSTRNRPSTSGRVIKEKYFKDFRRIQKVDSSVDVDFKILKQNLKLPTINRKVEDSFL